MATVFTITAATTSLRIDAEGRAECSFTVSNTSGRRMRGRASLKVDAPAERSWFTVAGDAEREFAVGGTDQFSVKIAIPRGTAAGKNSFRLDVVSVQNPDDDFAEGPTVFFEVAAPPPAKKPFPWWIVAVVAAVVVIGIGLGLFFWLRAPPEQPKVVTLSVPNVVGMPLDGAKFELSKIGLKPGQATTQLTDGGTTGNVVSQTPAAGTSASPGTEIQLVTAQKGAKVPDAVGKSIEEAKQLLTGAGLRVGGPFILEAKSAAEDGKVQQEKPAAGTLVP